VLSRAPEVILMGDPRVSDVLVQDCGEPLVTTRDAVTASAYLGGDGDASSRWVRSSIRDRLVRAAELLSPAYTLALEEGWRPLAVQSRSFDRQVQRLAAAHPDAQLNHWRRLASRFVSPPEVAPHPTGAAVDVLLLGSDGHEVDMGCPIDTNPEASAGFCYTDHPDVPQAARKARAALSAAMRRAGFVNYPTEWWHWSHGDRYWAMVTGAPHAHYGPADLPLAASNPVS
jgi:D-alanyl-D-alanine dipeptidase